MISGSGSSFVKPADLCSCGQCLHVRRTPRPRRRCGGPRYRHRAPAYRTNRVSILDGINQPPASRNLSQNQIKRQFTAEGLCELVTGQTRSGTQLGGHKLATGHVRWALSRPGRRRTGDDHRWARTVSAPTQRRRGAQVRRDRRWRWRTRARSCRSCAVNLGVEKSRSTF